MSFTQQQINQYISILKQYETPKPKPETKREHQLEDCKPGFFFANIVSLIQKIEHTSSYNNYNRCHFKKNISL